MISENDFGEQYNPLPQTKDNDLVVPTYGDALKFCEREGYSENHIWAVTECDDDDSWMANPGPAGGHALGYLVTEKAWDTGDEIAMYFEDDFDADMDMADDDDMDDLPAPGM